MKIAIVGAGMAGLACAEQLVAAGHSLCLYDKARGPGGRMSTRRVASAVGEASFDHGAQYFTARDPIFQAAVNGWSEMGVAAPWPVAGADAWVGVPAMNAPVKTLAARHGVNWSTRIDTLVKRRRGWQLQGDGNPLGTLFDAVILAIPAEQAAELLREVEAEFATIARATPAAPCWTLMLAFAEPLNSSRMIFRDDPVIGWTARNSDKPDRTGPDSWVIQASPEWSLEHLEDSQEQVVADLSDRFAMIVGHPLPDPLVAVAHRWRYARSGGTEFESLYNDDLKIGVCGDWLIGPRVECAWLSGSALAKMICR